MSYQIRRGWPSNGAIDQVLTPDASGVADDGMFVKVVNGQCKVEAFTGAEAVSDPLYAFIIGKETVQGTRVGIMSDCVIELDSNHYVSGTYSANLPLTIGANGKLTARTATGEKTVAKILSWDATTGIMVVMFIAAH